MKSVLLLDLNIFTVKKSNFIVPFPLSDKTHPLLKMQEIFKSVAVKLCS